ncbi:MAG: hypothetical protein COT92_01775 [Candidatus Doudnabacteria bacterium CG10_big_fil_rev_8_21_14_0_10_42_18]|uniref:Cation-transporting P-type ATPase N-terminal domain-containing protein n=1 Tax=Candidatus Doudnabacteria bacterium CG10_big_fil_rev_8_21_14_0_10_42_18 TaxID=1974552 RepID=A0A2H0VB71_9BACT|nr:MAG: hypothetical protein COT92_01775 [Candidatus Doudnabacteria bacterium CG10_big_fil_rev_8_21_14_0_10_42_18]
MFWYKYTKSHLEGELKTDLENGLTQAEAKNRFLKYGPNVLPGKKLDGWGRIFFRQFKSSLIYVLLVAAFLVLFVGELTDSLIILGVLIFNAGIGAVQEGKSERTLEHLKKLSEAEAEVIRGGRELVIHEKEVVVGDVLILQEGQKVTADSRVIFSSNLSTDEAAMTGETGAIEKKDVTLSEEKLSASSQYNMLFKGTNVLSGNGRAVVVGTGVNTELGKISKALLQPQTEIPLQKNIRKLSQVLVYAILVLLVLLFIFGINAGRGVKEMFEIVVALAVSVIPEGLPLVITLILVTGVWRMSRRNALVKKLQAVEALGQANVIAVDKTGTLTRNEMIIKKLFADDKIYTVTGSGYKPSGKITFVGQPAESDPDVIEAGTIASLASRASARFNDEDQVFKVAGDPTEAAMAVFGEKLNLGRGLLFKEYKEVAEIPFSYQNKYRAVFYEHKDKVLCAIAGAPEVLFKMSEKYLSAGQSKNSDLRSKKYFDEAFEEFSKEGLRVVAFGFKVLPKTHTLDKVENIVLGGLYGIEDSIRPEAAAAIKKAQDAGVKVVMITGDHRITARAIAAQAGIYREGDSIITGNELNSLGEHELVDKLDKVSVFARVTPDDKIKIIKAYKQKGLIVAMTGDGVNDAPSLVGADLGVAMGKIGTEVAKSAADIVLLDDNLFSIVAAIEEGRSMYKTIQKALLFLFSTALGELLTIVIALFAHLPMPVLAVQILWLNLITDPFIGIALALEEKEPNLLLPDFKKPSAYFVDFHMLFQMLLMGLTMAIGTLYLFNLYHSFDYVKALTISLTTLAVFQWYNGFNSRSPNKSIFNKSFFSNKYLWGALVLNFALQILAVHASFMQKILRTEGLSVAEWVTILGVSFSVIVVEELRKLVYRLIAAVKRHRTNGKNVQIKRA